MPTVFHYSGFELCFVLPRTEVMRIQGSYCVISIGRNVPKGTVMLPCPAWSGFQLSMSVIKTKPEQNKAMNQLVSKQTNEVGGKRRKIMQTSRY